MSSNTNATDTDARLRALQTIWAVMLGSVFLYAAVGYFLRPPALTWRSLGHAGEGDSVALALVAAALYAVGLAAAIFVGPRVLRSYLRRAEAEQNPALVQTGFILALVVCEGAALLGLVILFLVGSCTAFALMGLSALAIFLLRPRREQLAAAGYKTGLTG